MRAIADRTHCIGAGICVNTAPTVFDLDDDSLVVVLPPGGELTAGDVGDAEQAVAICPAQALRLQA